MQRWQRWTDSGVFCNWGEVATREMCTIYSIGGKSTTGKNALEEGREDRGGITTSESFAYIAVCFVLLEVDVCCNLSSLEMSSWADPIFPERVLHTFHLTPLVASRTVIHLLQYFYI